MLNRSTVLQRQIKFTLGQLGMGLSGKEESDKEYVERVESDPAFIAGKAMGVTEKERKVASTITEMAKHWGLSRSTIYNLMGRGRNNYYTPLKGLQVRKKDGRYLVPYRLWQKNSL